MSEYIQIGVTALRDPATGGFLPSVPLYIRAEDQEKVEPPFIDDSALQALKDKYKQYMESSRRVKKKKSADAGTSAD